MRRSRSRQIANVFLALAVMLVTLSLYIVYVDGSTIVKVYAGDPFSSHVFVS